MVLKSPLPSYGISASHARDNGWAKGTGWIDGTAGHLVRRPTPEVLGSPICVAKKRVQSHSKASVTPYETNDIIYISDVHIYIYIKQQFGQTYTFLVKKKMVVLSQVFKIVRPQPPAFKSLCVHPKRLLQLTLSQISTNRKKISSSIKKGFTLQTSVTTSEKLRMA